MNDEYTKTPTKIRIFFEDTGYSIDAIDEEGNFTEEIWDHYNGERMTLEIAQKAAKEFAAEHGWESLPIVERQ